MHAHTHTQSDKIRFTYQDEKVALKHVVCLLVLPEVIAKCFADTAVVKKL